MIKEAIAKLVQKSNLSGTLMQQVMEEIMTGQASPVEMASFLTALSVKGESVEEITAAAQIMRAHAQKIKAEQQYLLDTCGTGGDASGTFNISTIAALLVSSCGAGIAVAKHGNRSVSSKCGSADLLLELGVKIELAPEKIEECLHRVGFAFLYAPLLHEATKYAQPVRKELGIRTIFNLLGPLTNPTAAPYQILGVYAAELTPIFAEVLNNLGSKHALVVHGDDGLDEITTTGISQISELKEGIVKTYKINPSTFSIPRAKPEDLKGGDAKTNAQIALAILKGEKGPKRDIVVLNAACAVYTADRGLSIKEAVGLVEQAIDSGKALEKLEILKEFTNKA